MKYSGQLEGFPKEIVKAMLKEQVRQGNKKDVSVFENYSKANRSGGGFQWDKSKDGLYFWHNIITHKIFDTFFERYSKQTKKQLRKRIKELEDNIHALELLKHSQARQISDLKERLRSIGEIMNNLKA